MLTNAEKTVLLHDIYFELAKHNHVCWTRWMGHMFTKGRLNKSGSFTIDKKSVELWKRQMATALEDLPEDETKSDFAEALEAIHILKQLINK